MPEENNNTLEAARFEFEKQKHHDELELRRSELELQREQAKQLAWRNPLVLAVIAAVIGLLSNAVVALINGFSERSLERDRAKATQELAEQKAEADRILEALKTGDPDKAAENLELLLRTKLVANEAAAIRAYLEQRKPGEGASLPAATISSARPYYEAIVGFDDRVLVADTSKAPFSSICLVKVDRGWATGFLVHRRIVVVPSYALEETDLPSTLVYVAPTSSVSPSGGVTPMRLIRRRTGVSSPNFSYLILPEDSSVPKPTFILPERALTNELIASSLLHFGGYAHDRGGLVYNTGNAVSVTGTHVYHLLDTGLGTGGSPIWIQDADRFVVVAVHLATGAANGPGKVAARLDSKELRAVVQSIGE